jgi:hypothetical protein
MASHPFLLRNPPYCASMILERRPKPTTVLLYIFIDGKGIQHGLCDGAQPGEGPGVGTRYRQAGVAAAADFSPLRTMVIGAD